MTSILEISSRDALLGVAAEWCRQMAAVEPGGFARIVAEDAVLHGLAIGGDDMRGPAEVQSFFERMDRLYPRQGCDLLGSVVEGDQIAVRWAMRFEAGLGDWRVSGGAIEGMSVMVIRDGRIAELWANFGRWWV